MSWRRGFALHCRVTWAGAGLVLLAASEWVVWIRAETAPVSADTMGTALLSGLSSWLVLQVLVVLGFGFLVRQWRLPTCGRLSSRDSELWLVLAVTAVGAVLRLAALQELPFGLWFDTAENGNQALRILNDPSYRPVFIADATQLPALFTYFDALSIKWLGPEALAVRVPSALLGAATVPAIWWLGRTLGGPVLGVAAAFVLATSRWHIDFSRLALASIVTPFALALALAATIVALRTAGPGQRIALAVLVGLSLSLGIWSYPSAVLTMAAVAGGVAAWVLRGRRQLWPRFRRGALVLAVAAATCVLSLLPLIGVASTHPELVVQRSQTVAASGANATHEVFESAIQHVLMFTVRGDRNGRHNTPGRPEVGFFAPFFLAGVGAALLRRGSGVGLALPGALFFLAPGIVTLPFEAPQSHRAIQAVVPASLLIALPIALIWSRNRTVAILFTALPVGAGTVESADYFRAQLQDPSVYLENSIMETQAGRWLRTLGANVPVLAGERFRTYPTVRYLSGDHPSIALPGAAVSEFLPLDATRSAAVLASFDERALFDRARALYSQGPIQTFGPPLTQGEPLLFTMFVSKREQERTVGVLAEDASGTQLRVSSVGSADVRTWSATMRVLQSGQYAVSGGGSTVAIDSEVVVTPTQPTADLFLAKGAHAMHVTRPDGAPPPQVRVSLSAAAPTASPGAPVPGQTDPLFFALPAPGGLLFSWQIEGRPIQALIDSAPHRGFEGTFSDGRPWTGQWRGKLRVDRSGEYAFHVEAISSATLFIDEHPVVPVNQVGGSGEASISLVPGWHDIRVEYVDRDQYARLVVNWRPPDEPGFSAIPDAVLLPALRLP